MTEEQCERLCKSYSDNFTANGYVIDEGVKKYGLYYRKSDNMVEQERRGVYNIEDWYIGVEVAYRDEYGWATMTICRLTTEEEFLMAMRIFNINKINI